MMPEDYRCIQCGKVRALTQLRLCRDCHIKKIVELEKYLEDGGDMEFEKEDNHVFA